MRTTSTSPRISTRSAKAANSRQSFSFTATLPRGVPLIVADGYHRICASYHIDENADVPCKMVELAAAPSS